MKNPAVIAKEESSQNALLQIQDKERAAQLKSVYEILDKASTGEAQSCAAVVAFGQTLAEMRRDYCHGILENSALQEDPLHQFHLWFQEALICQGVIEANAMVLSTTSRDLQITSRTVLLKGYDQAGFRFFTNSTSTKGKQIAENPHVALLFHWHALERQIHINGHVTMLPHIETEKYFQSRPRQSQLAAWASHQSTHLASREELEERFKKIKSRFENKIIPTPDFWNGYLVEPYSIEFWQGRSNRLHDRFRYTKKENRIWKIERLNP